MILVTGPSGYIGNELIKQLVELGYPFRILIEPANIQPDLPKGIDLDISVCSFSDSRGIKAALENIDVIYHLTGVEQSSTNVDLRKVEVLGVESLISAAVSTNVKRFFYLSHLGADRASAFHLMKAKGIAESIIKNCGLNYTIFRSSMVYGPGDNFTENLAKLIKLSPLITLVPADGSVLLQPIWIGDLITSLIWALDLPETENKTIEIGGPEHISFLNILQEISRVIENKRIFVEYDPARLNYLTQFLETIIKDFPTSGFWMDYLAENRICALDSLPRLFGINPARFHQKISYIREKH